MMKLFTERSIIFAALVLAMAIHASQATELDDMLESMLAHEVVAAPGYRARVVVPPGHTYDPLVMHVVDGRVWLNDDGKEVGETGSRMLAIDRDGRVEVLVDADKLAPISAGFDVAPEGFGEYGGQIFALSQPGIGDQAGSRNYIVQRIDPQADYAVSVFCTLPPIEGDKVSGIGVDAAFGPAGSPFAGRLYASTTLNGVVHAITPDGRCEPFVTFDAERHGGPLYLRFAPDGQSLLVTVVRGGIFGARGAAILSISPDGKISETAIAEGETMFGGLDIAPPGFGPWAGHLFVVEVGHYEIPVPAGQALRADGKVHRVTPDGRLELVASGLINPWALRFVGDRLWVADINGDFIYGKRELPDGFIIEITPE